MNSTSADVRNRFIALEEGEGETWEQPAGFDRDAAEGEIKGIHKQLERLMEVSLQLETGGFIQDAAFFADIFSRQRSMALCSTIRFSSFGRMFVMFGPIEAEWGAAAGRAKAFLAERGYTEIELRDLEQPYDGRHVDDALAEGYTWFTRFFSYL